MQGVSSCCRSLLQVSRSGDSIAVFRFILLPLVSGYIPSACLPDAFREAGKQSRGGTMGVHKLTADFARRAVVEDGAERTVYWDEKQPGFGLMVTERGHRSWVIQYRARHRSRRMTLDFVLSLADARKEARAILGEVARGGDPVLERRRAADAERHALRAIVDDYFAREGKKLRSANKRRAALDRHVLPKLGAWSIYDIKRSDVQKLLDQIEDGTSDGRADQVLAFMRKVFNWFAARSDDFRSPIIKGMARSKPKSRERILTDTEIRTLWKSTQELPVPLGQYVRFLLLTGCRRSEAAGATWSEFQSDEWTIPAHRHKSKADATVALSAAAKAGRAAPDRRLRFRVHPRWQKAHERVLACQGND
jgi:hypothetical protein